MLIAMLDKHFCAAFLPCTTFRAQTSAQRLSDIPTFVQVVGGAKSLSGTNDLSAHSNNPIARLPKSRELLFDSMVGSHISWCETSLPISQDGATNYRIAVARVTLRRGKSGGAEPHAKGVGRTCLNYAL
jgi:hypothetical protein